MKKTIISALSLFLLLGASTAQAELIKGTKSYQTKTYLSEETRAKPKPPVPAEMGAKQDPAQIEPAAGEEVKGVRPYEPQRMQLQEKIRLPRKD
jgi:hypothetical protein